MTDLDRRDLLMQAVLEAARAFMAAQLRYDHAPDVSSMPVYARHQALQELRDALSAERRSR